MTVIDTSPSPLNPFGEELCLCGPCAASAVFQQGTPLMVSYSEDIFSLFLNGSKLVVDSARAHTQRKKLEKTCLSLSFRGPVVQPWISLNASVLSPGWLKTN